MQTRLNPTKQRPDTALHSEAAALRAAMAQEDAAANPRPQHRPQRPAARPAPPQTQRKGLPRVSVNEVTLSEDLAHDGYEMRFPDKSKLPLPEHPAIIAKLKVNGWHFGTFKHGRFDPRWYAKRTPERLKLAIDILEEVGGACEVSEASLATLVAGGTVL